MAAPGRRRGMGDAGQGEVGEGLGGHGGNREPWTDNLVVRTRDEPAEESRNASNG